ncbi:MAG TPA: group 1 truncated hemoglobin [Planctomycetota bacterium]|nr:group 1 truncated hemoglobin [Planctomycetota bacterium]
MHARLTVLCLLFTAVCLAPYAQAEDSLYKRLGGYDAIAAVVDDFLGRLSKDEKIGRYFVGQSEDSLKKLRQHVVDQLTEATGGPAKYTGRSMKTVHTGLKITEDDWTRMMKHLGDTAAKFKLPEKEAKEVVNYIESLKKDIVGL